MAAITLLDDSKRTEDIQGPKKFNTDAAHDHTEETSDGKDEN